MSAVLTRPEDFCNAAIVRLGGKMRIGSLFDGTPMSRAFLDIYGQTRDNLLRSEDWGFAEGIAAGVISAGAPYPWTQQYAYPSDALKIRAVFSQADYSADTNNPSPVNWRIGNLLSGGSQYQVIWCNVANATLVYTRQITDPTAWEPSFGESLIVNMARRISMGGGNADIIKTALEEEAAQDKMAAAVQG